MSGAPSLGDVCHCDIKVIPVPLYDAVVTFWIWSISYIQSIDHSSQIVNGLKAKDGWTELHVRWFEPPHDKTNKMACVPSEGSDQPGHPPSLIRVFAVHFMGSLGPKLLSCRLGREDWLGWADAQAELSLCWAHSHFVGFVMRQIICWLKSKDWSWTCYLWLITFHIVWRVYKQNELFCVLSAHSTVVC